MKPIILFLALVVCSGVGVFAQGHIAPCSGSNNHSTGICYGYAIGRAAGKSADDATCDPLTLHISGMDGVTEYFEWHAGSALTGLSGGDLVKFADHVAYVTSVGNPVSQSRVDQYSTMRVQEETNVLLSNVAGEFGSWTGYYRKKSITATVRNSFTGGDVKINTVQQGAGSKTFNWWTAQTFEAVDGQVIGGLTQRFQNSWSTPDGSAGSSVYTYPKPSGTYTASFKTEYNITFQNDLPGASGGTIKVDNTTYSAPYVAHTYEQSPPQTITGEAVNQTINGIQYTFSSWSNGSTSASTTFAPTSNVTYTASFTAKPSQAENVYAGGTVGNPVQITWTGHPHDSVSYKIYRRVKPLGGSTGPEQLIASLNHGTTSYTDYDYNVTSTYSNSLLSYDVRSYFSPNGTYSDPNFVQVFGTETKIADGANHQAVLLSELPQSYEISSYPNPFNPSTTISYQIVEDANVQLKIYDVMGREVMTLVDAQKTAGYHSVQWGGKDSRGTQVSSGVYLYRFTASPSNGSKPYVTSGKLLLTK